MYQIRFAENRDIPAILELLRQVEQVHYDIRPDLLRKGTQKYDATAMEALLKAPDRPIFVAEGAHGVEGYCFCIRKSIREDPILLNQEELYIDDLCVDEASRGKGAAQALYAHAVAYAKQTGCDSITLNVWEGNDRARAFYEKQGLTPRKTMMEYRLAGKS